MVISVSKFTNGKLNLGLAKVSFGVTTYNVTKLHSIISYYKKGNVQAKLRETITVRTNNLTTTYSVSGQPSDSEQIYSALYSVTDFNFPDTPSLCTLIQNITPLPTTPVDIYGGGSGKTRVIGFISRSISIGSFAISVDGKNFDITIYPGDNVVILLVDTPETDKISAKAYSTTNVDYFVVEADTASANTDTYNVRYEELDASNNILDSGTDTGTFYWFFLTVLGVSSNITHGGAGVK